MAKASMRILRPLPPVSYGTMRPKARDTQRPPAPPPAAKPKEEAKKKQVRAAAPIEKPADSSRRNPRDAMDGWAAVAELARQGKTNAEIAAATGYAKNSIGPIIQKMRARGEDIPRRSKGWESARGIRIRRAAEWHARAQEMRAAGEPLKDIARKLDKKYDAVRWATRGAGTRRQNVSDADQAELIRLYEAGESISDIALKLGVSKQCINNRLYRLRMEGQAGRRRKPWKKH